ncbi:hypothetical protein WJX72_006875 [[Myrmecia] bisecta]|uniref:FGFR1 oncogene partner (FOP) N-terminal dimerisation domain-containing protein n=1 Tax=[Myrmecia] bisecta TaxID=41462 RepID=A0AAW1PEC4_9CHLO
MASAAELKWVLQESLERNGAMRKLKAQVRAEVFHALEEQTGGAEERLSSENLLINELLREYCNFNHYRNTLSVLLPETGQPEKAPFSRVFLAKKLGVADDATSRKLPLIYALVAQAQQATSYQPSPGTDADS